MALGPLVCNLVDVSPGRYGRTPRVLRDGNDDLLLLMNLGGSAYQAPSEIAVVPGAIHLVDNTRLGSLMVGGGCKILSFTIPRRRLLTLVPHGEDLANREFQRDAIASSLLRGYRLGLLGARSLTSEAASVAGNHILDMIALSLGASGPSAEIAAQQGLRTARYSAVRDVISANLSDPALSLASVARANAISERYVQRLFEEHGTSFTDYVNSQRLACAFSQLSNPLLRNRRVVDIVEDCGFGDLSHFNRMFRRRYGMTPTEARNH